MALLPTILAVCLACEWGAISFKSSAQYFTTPPVASIDLQTDTGPLLGQLFCYFNKQSSSDVVGWVVTNLDGETARIANENSVYANAVMRVLGPGVSLQITTSATDGSSSGTYYTGLDFYSITPAVAGDYKCQLCTRNADDECGTVIEDSSISEVRLQYEPTDPPICLPTSTPINVVLGESVNLSCTSDPGLPTVQLEWLRDNVVIPNEPVRMNGLLYNNLTYVPEISDSGSSLTCRMTTASNMYECNSSPFSLSSPPIVTVQAPQSVEVGLSATFTCLTMSETDTPISEYSWTVEESVSPYTTSADGTSITITSVVMGDHGKRLQCEVTDDKNLNGEGEAYILITGEVVPTGIPTPDVKTDPPSTQPVITTTNVPAPFPVAAIAAIAVVGFILLCFLLGGLWFYCNKMKRGKAKHFPPTVEKNNLSPNSTSPFTSKKTFEYPSVDPKRTDPDVIPKGMNELPVDINAQKYWRDSDVPADSSPTIKSVNMPFQSKGSKASLHETYNYNPTYDDKVDPADFKAPLDDRDYSDSGIGYRDVDDGYADVKYGKPYSDVPHYGSGDYDDRNYSDREYGDGHPEPYPHDYGDPSNYGSAYDDDYQSSAGQHGGNYDDYPDRMPDGSEGYGPTPEEYNNGYSAPMDYDRPSDYNPLDYGDQPNDYGYDGQPVGYDDRPLEYDYQPSDYPPNPASYGNEYDPAPYDDQYNQPPSDHNYPERIPDGGAPDADDYNYGYQPENVAYEDGYGYNSNYDYAGDYVAPDQNQPPFSNSYVDDYPVSGSPQAEPYYDLEDEVSATSNPSYV